jgi:hypothetical protein
MAKTLLIASGGRIDGTSGASFFLPIGMNIVPADITRTEAEVGHTVTKAGTISDLRANVQLNNASNAGTVHLRKNGVDVLSVTITASTTGWFTMTGSVTVAPGDIINLRVANGNNATFYRAFVANYEADDGTITQWLSSSIPPLPPTSTQPLTPATRLSLVT